MGRFVLMLIFSLAAVCMVNAKTKVTCYEHHSYRGGAVPLEDIEDFTYYYFTSFDNKLTSFKIDRGSCIIMDVDNPPSGNSFWADGDISNVGDDWNDKISTVYTCGTEDREIHCPEGTFVKKIEWDDGNSLRNGIRLFCSEPRSKTSSATLFTHPDLEFQGSRAQCTGLRGIAYGRNEIREADEALVPICHPGESNGNTIICEGNTAVTGMTVTIENHSNQIKSSTLHCGDVGDIESICEAHDVRSVLFVCDATEAVGELRCERTKKVGIGGRTSMSEEYYNEHEFYYEFGFDIRYAGFGLAANFNFTIGESERTGYNWATAQESTWEEEISLTVEITAPPGCRTTVSEIVGDCSFMAVRPNIFYRNDTCNDGISTVTQVTIPKDFKGKVFHSPVPYVLQAKMLENKNKVVQHQPKDLVNDIHRVKPTLVKLTEKVL